LPISSNPRRARYLLHRLIGTVTLEANVSFVSFEVVANQNRELGFAKTFVVRDLPAVPLGRIRATNKAVQFQSYVRILECRLSNQERR